jgi:Ca2+-binding EF-hand superfamily protein
MSLGLLRERRNYFLRNESIPVEVVVSLGRILDEEANLIRSTKKLKVELTTSSHFKVYQLFELLVNADGKCITTSSLRRFMRTNGYYLLDSETTYVIERLDKDKDGRVTYVDFLESLTTSKDYAGSSFDYRWSRTIMTEPRSWSPQISSERKYKHLTRSVKLEHKRIHYPEEEFRPFNPQPNTPFKKIEVEERKEKFLIEPKDKHADSPLRIEDLEVIRKRRGEVKVVDEKEVGDNFSPIQESSTDEIKEEPVKIEEPVKEELKQEVEEIEELKQEEFITPRQLELKSPEWPTTSETPLRSNLNYLMDPELLKARSELLAKLLKDQLFIDKFTEEKREQLYARPDYNPKEAFKFFSDGKRDAVSLFDLKWGLNKLGVYKSNENLITMMRRYDLNKDGKLSYEEFEAMLSPREKIEKAFVEDKPLSELTKHLFKTLLTSIIENEVMVERIRSDIGKYAEVKHLYLESTFNDLNESKRGYLTIEDVSVSSNDR